MLFLYTSQADLSISDEKTHSIPFSSAANLNPPIPANKSMNLILLFFFIFSLSGMYSIISSILHSKQAQIRLSTSILTFLFLLNLDKDARSEERRVGKE